ncbi:hypothetical protein ACSSNL_08620 [Thalassobius sp. S69A]|uniref:hypothetical protein n=1 Tax=unclassified Thalassovita TaxID=2619711 RepID=UPI000C0D4D30|nr:hypothetical protein [Paracoccaceae bacterium]MBT26441.1 hypothetical protein [Paracoccaceae bacterium]
MKSPFYTDLQVQIAALGGMHNAHIHLDRANTLADGYVDHGRVHVLESSHISLQKKHALIRTVHEGPAYDPPDLDRRARETIDVMVAANTRLADTMVDCTADRVGTHALSQLMDLAAEVRDQIQIRCAAYTPLGFRNSEPERWRIFEQGVQMADFIGSLPEADDVLDYPDNIGFEEHCVRMLDLVKRTGKFLHVHTDQINSPGEDGTERLIKVMQRETGRLEGADGQPLVWTVHMISPSTYDEPRWERFVQDMLALNIGVICCPSAAIGMRQLRAIATPMYNSIPRVLELAEAGVPIRLGSDNIADMCSPSTTADMTEEVFTLSAAVRYYRPEILAKFAAGAALSPDERAIIREHLDRNNEEMAKLVQRFGPK